MYDVRNNKVTCDRELENKGIYCMLDVLIIDDPDIANVLIDLGSIETLLLVEKVPQKKSYPLHTYTSLIFS